MSEADQISASELESIKNPSDGRSDPNKQFPRKEYVGVSSVNNIARGTKVSNVYIGGSVPGLDFELNDEPSTEYPNNQVKETASGHIIEYDDTNGRERVMIRHRTGSGVEMRADGSVIFSSTNNTLRIVAANEKAIIEGDGEVVYNGNLKMRVAGDFDLEVGGDFNVNVTGNKEEIVKSSYIESITKNKTLTVGENKAETILGIDTLTVLSDKNEIIKGNHEANVEGIVEIDAGGKLIMSSENKTIMTSPDVNIAAKSLSVVGDSGTVGGHEIVYYGKTAHIPRVNSTSIHASQGVIADVGMTAPTFNGNLAGNANTAGKAATAAVGPAAGSAQSSVTFTEATNKNTVQPDTSILASVMTDPEYGVRQIEIDTFDDLKFSVNRSRNYGGITVNDLTIKSVRSKLRDPNTLSNETFVGEIVSEGLVSKDFANAIPPQFGKSVSVDDKSQRGEEALGPSNPKAKVFQHGT